MTFHLGPGRLYVAPMGTPPSLFLAPVPPRRWSLAWLRSKLPRRRRLSKRWVEIGHTTEGANFTYTGEVLP